MISPDRVLGGAAISSSDGAPISPRVFHHLILGGLKQGGAFGLALVQDDEGLDGLTHGLEGGADASGLGRALNQERSAGIRGLVA